MIAIRWVNVLLLFWLLQLVCLEAAGDPEYPKQPIDAHKVLEGITEPFDIDSTNNLPAWKVLKNAADHKASGEHLQQALKEYGYIVKHSHLFSEMPPQERYDIFLSMAKLLKIMGFHQRAEALLYESIGYTQTPFESHFQLTLLALEKEDLSTAKMHLKNCLFLKETDTQVLIHFAAILMAEGKTHEAKFYISRILSVLEGKVLRLVELMKSGDQNSLFGGGKGALKDSASAEGSSEQKNIYNNINKWNRKRSRSRKPKPPAGSTEAEEVEDDVDTVFAPFAKRVEHAELQHWLEDLMLRVFHGDYHMTLLEKDASSNRGGAFYNPARTSNVLDTFQMFSNLYDWLADGEMTGRFVFDIGQALYECGKTEVGLMMMTRGHASSNPVLEGQVSVEIVKIRLALDYPMVPNSLAHILEAYLNMTQFLARSSYEPIDMENVMDVYWPLPLFPFSGLFTGPVMTELMYRFNGGPIRHDSPSVLWLSDSMMTAAPANASEPRRPRSPTSSDSRAQDTRIEIGIFGGHMSNHPVGLTVLHRLLSLDPARFRLTLLATPLYADHITRDIASKVDEIVNIPMATDLAWKTIEQKLHLDVLLFPDWQPFPDQLNILYQSRRIAPVQVCVFIRGTTCAAGDNIDFYMLPEDVYEFHRQSQAVNYALVSKTSGPGGDSYSLKIPPWLSAFHEQVVVLDWPVFTSQAVADVFKSVSALPDDSSVPKATDGKGRAGALSRLLTQPDPYATLIETEGQIFFDNQPVAIIATHPSLLHPLMDSVLIDILKATTSCQLQLLLVLPEIHFSDAMMIPKYRISWARRLVRRLWLKAGSLSNRIRLLPAPVSDKRLLYLYRQADMVLDSFPYGSSLHSHALALSVGTPVVTMRSGLTLSTDPVELDELRKEIVSAHSKRLSSNPVFQYILKHDVPWVPTNCPLAAFYRRLSQGDTMGRKGFPGVGTPVDDYTLEDLLVASDTRHYQHIVSLLATDKEAAYRVRVKLLDAIDKRKDLDHWQPAGTAPVRDRMGGGTTRMHMNEDLEAFLSAAGKNYAELRVARRAKNAPTTAPGSPAGAGTGSHRRSSADSLMNHRAAEAEEDQQQKQKKQSREQQKRKKQQNEEKRPEKGDSLHPQRAGPKKSRQAADGHGYFRSLLEAWIA